MRLDHTQWQLQMYYKEVKLDFDARSLHASMYLLQEVGYERISCSRHRKTKFTNSESPIFTTIFFNNIRLMYTLCFLVASVKLKVYKKVVKFSFKQQEILGIRNS